MAPPRPAKAAKPPEPPDEAPQEAPVGPGQAPPAQEAPDDAPKPQEAVRRRYRADRALGATRRGEEFEADDSDPRVRSGYVTALDGDNVPDEVKAALADG